MSLHFYIKKGDRLPPLRVQLFNPDGTPRDITSGVAGIVFNMGVHGEVNKITDGAVTEITPAEGIIQYDWAAGDTDTVESYRGEFVVTDDDGKQETFPKETWIQIEVLDEV